MSLRTHSALGWRRRTRSSRQTNRPLLQWGRWKFRSSSIEYIMYTMFLSFQILSKFVFPTKIKYVHIKQLYFYLTTKYWILMRKHSSYPGLCEVRLKRSILGAPLVFAISSAAPTIHVYKYFRNFLIQILDQNYNMLNNYWIINFLIT